MAQSASEIDAQAAYWAARVDRGPLSPTDSAALDDWLAADPRRLGAYGRMRGLALHTERARVLPRVEAASDTRANRRQWLAGVTGIAASLGAAVLFRGSLFGDPAVATRKGEVRVVALQDGSVVTLDTSTRLSVHLGTLRREIALEGGEALFEVAHDSRRPFIVTAGEMRVTAVGTAFAVRRQSGQPTRVLVQKGVVEVVRGEGARPFRLAAGMGAVGWPANVAAHVTDVGATEMNRQLAWRDGRLEFSGQTLEQAVAEFARYSDTRIIVAEPALRDKQVIGLFNANDPVGFARAVAASLGAEAVVEGGEVRIVRDPGTA